MQTGTNHCQKRSGASIDEGVVACRKKRTVEESQKLKHVQEELQKVDTLLVADVSKLMHCIDEASCAFMEAQ